MGEVVKLDVNSVSIVQFVVFMRFGLFVFIFKLIFRSKMNCKNVMDVIEEFVQLFIVWSEGYIDVRIIGLCFDMDMDFKVWFGIICLMYDFGVKDDMFKLFFVEFVKMCGFDFWCFNKKMCDRISNFLFKLVFVIFKFQSEMKGWIMYLVQFVYYDIIVDVVEIRVEFKFFEFYQMDRWVLLCLKVIDVLQCKEFVQVFYIYIESLLQNLVFIFMKCM